MPHISNISRNILVHTCFCEANDHSEKLKSDSPSGENAANLGMSDDVRYTILKCKK